MKILERQHWHLIALLALVVVVALAAQIEPFQRGSFLAISTPIWLVLSVVNAVLHQAWVLLFWRLELHHGAVSRWLGSWGFPLYAIGFALLILARPVVLAFMAIANSGTLPLATALSWSLAILISLPVLYVLYSVARYFGFRRALGADHFDPSYRQQGLERRGSFGLIRNSMYALGLLFLWLPGLIWRSNAALLAAAFQHAYIWVHYYTVELPDMRHIYGQSEVAK